MRPVALNSARISGKAQGPAPSRRTSLHVVKAPVRATAAPIAAVCGTPRAAAAPSLPIL